MKVITLLGSARKKGNTAKVLGWLEDALRERGLEVERVNLASLDIRGCLGCGVCKKSPDEIGCVQKDDVPNLFGQMLASDVVVYASPVYFWDFSSQLKTLIDRHYSLVTGFGGPDHASLMENKRTALLMTCEDELENNAEFVQEIFERVTDYLKCKSAGKCVIPLCTTPDALGPDAKEAAEKLALDIASL